MSVRMTLTVTADPKQLEQFASGNKEKMQAVLEAAKHHGLIAHRFFGSDSPDFPSDQDLGTTHLVSVGWSW